MRKITLSAILVLISTLSFAATGWFNDFLTISVNGASTPNNYYIGTDPATGATALQAKAFGLVTSLEITGADMMYWSDTQDRTGAAFYYKITNASNTFEFVPTTEIIMDHAFILGNNYQGTKSLSVNLLAGLPAGAYQLHVWAKSWSGAGGEGDSWLSNNSANYVATFMKAPASTTPMSGTYKVGNSGAADFNSLSAAINAVNTYGVGGNVLFEIVSNLTETGGVKLLVPTMGSNAITIKPSATTTPTITFTGCVTTTGATSYTGFGIDNTSNLIIDGSNTLNGTTKDLTFKMNDGTNGRNVIQLFGNCDNVTIKNVIISYMTPMSTANSTRGIYLNGQSTGACDNFIVENCSIGDATNTPYYAVSITGYGTAPAIYSTNNAVRNNILFGRIRPVYLYFVGTTGTTNDIIGNTISTIGGANGTTTYTIMWNTWAGTLNIKNNKIPTLTVANTSGTNGVYGISGLTSAVGSIVNMSNNFVGGTNASTGVSIPTVFSLIYIQDAATYNVYNNTFYYSSMTNASEKSNIHISGTGCVVNLKNNIIVNNTDNATAYCVWKSNGTLTSDNNVFSTTGTLSNIGYLTSAKQTLANWQTAFTPNNDLNSRVGNVTFANAATGDLSISGLSVQDINLKVPSLAAVTTDIFGTVRNTEFTYAGAHESTLPFITTGNETPVELSARIIRTMRGIEVQLNREANIELYTINGVLIDKTRIEGTYARDLNNGIYIIRIDGKATKFVK